MRQLDVPVIVLQHESSRALQDAGAAAGKPRRVAAADDLLAAGLDADQPDRPVLDERVEHADRVAAATDTGDDGVRQPSRELEDLLARLAADDRLELANHQWIRMRSEHRA